MYRCTELRLYGKNVEAIVAFPLSDEPVGLAVDPAFSTGNGATSESAIVGMTAPAGRYGRATPGVTSIPTVDRACRVLYVRWYVRSSSVSG